jgi:hypothetical protein
MAAQHLVRRKIKVKAELVRRLSTSCEQRVRQLFSHEEMGDQKPSQFLRHFKGLAPNVPDDFLRTIWASHLPPHVQTILARQAEGSLKSAFHLADRICEITPLPTKASISPSKPDSTVELLERVEELSRQAASPRASQTHSRSQSKDRHRSHSRDRRRSTRDNFRTPHDTCWYHWKFGNATQQGTPPCSHQQSENRQLETSTSGR